MRRPVQLPLVPRITGRGGYRPGAGRPKGVRPRVRHRVREKIPVHCPVHVTLRIQDGVPSLRKNRFVQALRPSLAACCERKGFRVVHYSVQTDHIHFVVEALGKDALANGMKSLGARVARTVNRVFVRKGPVLDGRFHHRLMKTPRDVRNTIAYVLLNARHHFFDDHGQPPPVTRLDPLSSSYFFDGWRFSDPDPPPWRRDIAWPRTWLLRVGWRKHHPLIGLAEVPGPNGPTNS